MQILNLEKGLDWLLADVKQSGNIPYLAKKQCWLPILSLSSSCGDHVTWAKSCFHIEAICKTYHGLSQLARNDIGALIMNFGALGNSEHESALI